LRYSKLTITAVMKGKSPQRGRAGDGRTEAAVKPIPKRTLRTVFILPREEANLRSCTANRARERTKEGMNPGRTHASARNAPHGRGVDGGAAHTALPPSDPDEVVNVPAAKRMVGQ